MYVYKCKLPLKTLVNSKIIYANSYCSFERIKRAFSCLSLYRSTGLDMGFRKSLVISNAILIRERSTVI